MFTILIIISLIIDAIWIANTIINKNELKNYITFESINVDSSNLMWVKGIKTYLRFRGLDQNEKYLKFDSLEKIGVYEVAKWSIDPNPERESLNGIDTSHGTEEIKRGIINSKINFLIPFYEKKLMSAYLKILRYKFNPPSSSDGFDQFGIRRPITEDSVYFGGFGAYTDRYDNDEIYKFIINQKIYEMQEKGNTYSIAAADTLIIESIQTKYKGSRIDTMSDFQTLAKRNGRWWNINSPDPK
ncbi:MAG TPA: hypothetical protein VFG10_21010 [Saprospiraceae bacterium]|nr:hypothetical protein [Saprospiraceae bacterium]